MLFSASPTRLPRPSPWINMRPLIASGAAARRCRSAISCGPGPPYHNTPSGQRTSWSSLHAVLPGSAYWWVQLPAPGSAPRLNVSQVPSSSMMRPWSIPALASHCSIAVFSMGLPFPSATAGRPIQMVPPTGLVIRNTSSAPPGISPESRAVSETTKLAK